MRTWSRQCGVVAGLAVLMVLAGCGSSTSPTPAPPTAEQLAADFDAIYSSLNAAGTSADSEAAITIAQYVESAPADGGTETSFTATTTGGNATWNGVAEAFVVNSNTDTVYFVSVYPHLNLDTLVVAGIEMSNGTLAGQVAYGTTNQFVTYSVGTTAGSAIVTSTGAACSLETGLAAELDIEDWIGTTANSCVSATFEASFSITFQNNALGNASVVMGSNQTFKGPLFVPIAGSHVVGIPSKGQAAAEALDAMIHRR